MNRRGFFRTLLGLAAAPVLAKLAPTWKFHAWHGTTRQLTGEELFNKITEGHHIIRITPATLTVADLKRFRESMHLFGKPFDYSEQSAPSGRTT